MIPTGGKGLPPLPPPLRRCYLAISPTSALRGSRCLDLNSLPLFLRYDPIFLHLFFFRKFQPLDISSILSQERKTNFKGKTRNSGAPNNSQGCLSRLRGLNKLGVNPAGAELIRSINLPLDFTGNWDQGSPDPRSAGCRFSGSEERGRWI